MAFKVRKSQRPQYAYAAGAQSQDAGQRQSNRLLGQGQTMFLTVVITALLNVTVAGTGTLNRGSVMAAFDEMGIQENGKDRQYVDPRILRYIAETTAPSAPTALRAASAAIQANTNLRETFRVYFAHPFSLNPRETNFIVSDPTADFSFFHKLNAANNGVGKIVAGGTATLTNVVVKVQQSLDQFEAARPTFIPTIRMVSQQVNGANTDLEILLRPGNYVRALVIQQDSNIGEVSDIINSLSLTGDRNPIIGPEKTDWSLLTQAEEYDWGGNMLGAPGYAYINFQEQGKLTNVWNPTQDTNMRLLVNCQPSVVAGVVTSIIRVAILELERDAAKVDLAGQPLVGPLDIPV
jgi:hypothetical protein